MSCRYVAERSIYVCSIFDLYMLPKSKLINANIRSGSVRFGSGRNKLVKLLIRSRNREGRTIRSLINTNLIVSLQSIYCCSVSFGDSSHGSPTCLHTYMYYITVYISHLAKQQLSDITTNRTIYRVVQRKKIAQILMHRHFATVRSRITLFSPCDPGDKHAV